MIKKYLALSFRIFIRNKLYMSINILGLALGLASCLICYLHLSYELGYDDFHENRESIYRVITGELEEDDYWVMMAAPVPPVLKQEFPEVEEYVRMAFISWDPKILVKHYEKVFNEQNFFLVDSSFFSVFNYRLILGDRATALSSPDGVVITESNAKKYFGDEDPLGKEIEVNGEFLFRVTGVIEDAPHNSHLDYSFLASFENLSKAFGENAAKSWGSYNYFAYIKTVPNSDIQALRSKIKDYNFQATEDRLVSFENIDLQAISDIHFMSNRGNLKPAYNITYIYIFWALSIALLTIASINYINLSIAHSESRIREVAIKKAAGARHFQITIQFMTETLFYTFVSMGLALLLLRILLPFLNRLLENRIALDFSRPGYLFLLIGITLLIGIIAGSYLAFFVSRYRPALILKGTLKIRSGDINLRKALLFMQFLVVSALLICSLTIRSQLLYIQKIDLGLEKENVVDILIFDEDAKQKIPLLKQELLKSPLVISAGASAFQPGAANFNQTVRWEGQEESMSMFLIPADKDYISTMGITLLEGDLEQIQSLSDSSYTWILNETARDLIGWEQAYGKSFTAFGGDKSFRPVSGVIGDFKFMSLHHEVGPLVLVLGNAFSMDRISVRIEGGTSHEVIAFLEEKFKETMPGIPFEYRFFEDSLNILYAEEARSGRIIGVVSIITIAIALFGLFGLISFSLKQRSQEIAIRKVHGISISTLIMLVTKYYLMLVLVSNLIAIPVAWFLMNRWLQNFAYRTSISSGTIFLSTLIILVLVVLSIFYRTLKTARSNPVEALQYE